MSRDFLLVIPAYEEHRRLPSFLRELMQELAGASFTTSIRIVDDGSTVESRRELAQVLAEMETPGSARVLPVLSLPKRSGKGCAIRTGWNAGPSVRWLAFVDADGAIPAAEVRRIFGRVAEEQAPGICTGVRVLSADRRVRRVWYRKWIGGWFGGLIRVLFGCSFRDPQCGFKIISALDWESVGDRSREDGFCFDLELLLLLQSNKSPITEIPIDWEEKSGSHVSPLRDGWRTLLALGALRLRKSMRGW